MSTEPKNTNKNCERPYLLILLLAAGSWAATIFGSIFELSTHKNLPIDMSQALSTLHTLDRRQPFSAVSSRLAAGTRNFKNGYCYDLTWIKPKICFKKLIST